MTLAELETAVGWLERNRLRDHLHLIEADPQYRWAERARRAARRAPGAWIARMEREEARRAAQTGTRQQDRR
jgi:hypothetical protein